MKFSIGALIEIEVKSKLKMAYMSNGLNCCPNHQCAKFNYIVKRYFKVKITSFKTIRNHGGECGVGGWLDEGNKEPKL